MQLIWVVEEDGRNHTSSLRVYGIVGDVGDHPTTPAGHQRRVSVVPRVDGSQFHVVDGF